MQIDQLIRVFPIFIESAKLNDLAEFNKYQSSMTEGYWTFSLTGGSFGVMGGVTLACLVVLK